MPSKAKRPCSRCGQPATRRGLCDRHGKQADSARGTSTQRGYNSRGHQSFRIAVLTRDNWTCVLCGAEASHADHYPLTRRQLIAQHSDPDSPDAGRALCQSCHMSHTAKANHLGGSPANR